MADDPYATLGVRKNASEEDIRRAFRKLAKELHPDIAKGTEERFKKVSSAYEILGDPDKRARLRPRRDRRPRRAAPPGLPPVRARRRGAGAGAGGGGFDEFGFGDIFSDIFGAAGQRAGARPNFVSKGHDVRYTLEVDFLEAVSGATKRVTLPGGGTLDLNVPAGVADAQVLRLKGKGSARRRRGRGGRCAGRDPRAPARAVQARRRRHPARGADHHRRGGARRQDRGADRLGPRAAHRPEGHELGPRVPPEGQGRQERRPHGGRAISSSPCASCCRRRSTTTSPTSSPSGGRSTATIPAASRQQAMRRPASIYAIAVMTIGHVMPGSSRRLAADR